MPGKFSPKTVFCITTAARQRSSWLQQHPTLTIPITLQQVQPLPSPSHYSIQPLPSLPSPSHYSIQPLPSPSHYSIQPLPSSLHYSRSNPYYPYHATAGPAFTTLTMLQQNQLLLPLPRYSRFLTHTTATRLQENLPLPSPQCYSRANPYYPYRATAGSTLTTLTMLQHSQPLLPLPRYSISNPYYPYQATAGSTLTTLTMLQQSQPLLPLPRYSRSNPYYSCSATAGSTLTTLSHYCRSNSYYPYGATAGPTFTTLTRLQQIQPLLPPYTRSDP